MIKKTTILIAFIAIIFSINPISSQRFNDFSNVNYLDLNQSEMDLLLRRASAQGYNTFDLLKIAKSQGLTESDLDKLDKRFRSAQTVARVAETSAYPLEDTRLRLKWNDEFEILRDKTSDVFGYEVFNGNNFLTFQSNLNIPTPKDYVIGPGDKLFIDLFGESENYYQGEVSPEGNIILENFGPINLSGLTVDQAKIRLKNNFKKYYTGIQTGKTKFNLSIGIPRAVRVNIVGEVNLPGTYTFSAFNTVYNAIYVAGGITENGTLREIKHYRSGKLINIVDAYKFILNGNDNSNIRLENDDLIVVGPYTNRVTISSGVKTHQESLK